MDRTKQEKTVETPVVSPLAKDKTYGEKKYDLIFDWGLNYWANLTASAAFSQWVEHATKPVKLMFIEKPLPSPRQIQANFAEWLTAHDPFMQSFAEKMRKEKPLEAPREIFERSMARSRSLTLLLPGFAVMIPAVWLGAKIKPWFVERLNKKHYGDEAMEDPSLKARHQAVRAEECPTFLGTFMARLGTVVAVQATAQGVGSENNFLNKAGEKYNIKFAKTFGINSFTDHVGEVAGGAMPEGMKKAYNTFTQKHGLDWSEDQIKKFAKGEKVFAHLKPFVHNHPTLVDAKDKLLPHVSAEALKQMGVYTNATQDLGRFLVTDTIYTLVSAFTVRPFLKLLSHVPGMTYKPKIAAPAATVDSDKIKIPGSPFTDTVADSLSREASVAATANEHPSRTVSDVRDRTTLAERSQPQIA